MRTRHAIEQLYREHYGFVWHAVRRLGVVGTHADDAVQDTFVTAYRRYGRGPTSAPRAWLYGIARRVASNYRRTEHRGLRKQAALTEAAIVERSTTTPEGLLALERTLTALAAEERELFVLSEVDGMTGPELADALGLNLSTTYSRIQTLRRKLRATAEPAGDEAIVAQARAARPRATARGWAMLLPRLVPGTLANAMVTFASAVILATPATVALASVVEPRAAPTDRSPMPIPAAIPTTPAEAVRVAVFSPPAAPASAIEPPRNEPASPRARAPAESSVVHAQRRSLVAEVARLRLADQRLAAGDATGAIAEIDAHAREFPDSSLGDARRALRIAALCRQGKAAQARAETRALVDGPIDALVHARLTNSCVADLVDRTPDVVDCRRCGHEGDR